MALEEQALPTMETDAINLSPTKSDQLGPATPICELMQSCPNPSMENGASGSSDVRPSSLISESMRAFVTTAKVVFPTEDDVRNDEERYFQCNLCTEVFPTRTRLSLHLLSRHETMHSLKCNKCELVFTTREDLSRHICPRSLAGCRKTVWEHYMKVFPPTSQTRFPCPDCPKTFDRSELLRIHQRVHRSYTPFEHDVGRSTRSEPDAHALSTAGTAGKLPFHCEICRRKFLKRQQRENHKVKVMRAVPRKFPLNSGRKIDTFYRCRICFEAFSNVEELRGHSSSVHSGRMDYEYHGTTLIVYSKNRIPKRPHKPKRHKRTVPHGSQTHENNPFHRCQKCERNFFDENQLIKHALGHLERKPFFCLYCPEAFDEESSLIGHTSRHHGEVKPYKCDICYKMFSRVNELDLHKGFHVGEKPYGCIIRPYRERHYQCAACGELFDKKTAFNEHKSVHPDEIAVEMSDSSRKVTASLSDHPRSLASDLPHSSTHDVIKHKRIYSEDDEFELLGKINQNSTFGECSSENHSSRHDVEKYKRIHCEEDEEEFDEFKFLGKRNQNSTYGESSGEDELSFSGLRSKHEFENLSDKLSSFSLAEHGPVAIEEKESFECSICMKKFTGKSYLKKHALVHKPGKPDAWQLRAKKMFSPELDTEQLVQREVSKRKASFIVWNRMQAKSGRKGGELGLEAFCRKFGEFSLGQHRPTREEASYQCEACMKNFKDTDEFSAHKCAPTDGKTL